MRPSTDTLSISPVTSAWPVSVPAKPFPIKPLKLVASMESADKDKFN